MREGCRGSFLPVQMGATGLKGVADPLGTRSGPLREQCAIAAFRAALHLRASEAVVGRDGINARR